MRFFRFMTLVTISLVFSACGSSNNESIVNADKDDGKGLLMQEFNEVLIPKLEAMGLQVFASKRADLGVDGLTATLSAFRSVEQNRKDLWAGLAAASAKAPGKIQISFGIMAYVTYETSYLMAVDAKFLDKKKQYGWTDAKDVDKLYAKFIGRQIELLVAMVNNDSKDAVTSDRVPSKNPSQVFYKTTDDDFAYIIRRIPDIKLAVERAGMKKVVLGHSNVFEFPNPGRAIFDVTEVNIAHFKASLPAEQVASGSSAAKE